MKKILVGCLFMAYGTGAWGGAAAVGNKNQKTEEEVWSDLQRTQAQQFFDKIDHQPSKSYIKKSIYADFSVLGAGAASLGYWLYQSNEGEILRQAPTRFMTGIEAPFAMSVAKALVGPLVVLSVGAWGYYRLKNVFIEPYKQENEAWKLQIKQEYAQTHANLLARLEKQSQATHDQLGKIKADGLQVRTNVITIQQQMEKTLQEERDKHHKALNNIQEMVDKKLQELAAQNAQENKELHEKLTAEYQALKQKVHAMIQQSSLDLSNLQNDLRQLGANNKDMKLQVEQAMEAYEKMAHQVSTLEQHTGQELAILRACNKSHKELQAQIDEVKRALENKKDKKPSFWSSK